MSYPPPQGGYPPQQGGYPLRQGGYPPQQGDFPPQQGGYPPQQGGFPLQQGGHPPQQGGYFQQQGGYLPPQGGYLPQQGGYPPQQGGYSPQQGGYPQQGPYPQYGGPQQSPQPGYQRPPPNPPSGYPPNQAAPGYGAALPPQYPHHGQVGPQGYSSASSPLPPLGSAYGASGPQSTQPPGLYGYGAQPPGPGGPTRPSPGYEPHSMATTDAAPAAEALRKAMKGFGTDEAALIRTLAHYPALLIQNLKSTYQHRLNRSLESDIKSETSGYFEHALLSILRGPLHEDVYRLHKALDGAGTNEDLLNDVLISRSNADLNAVKLAYQNMYHRRLEADVDGDLSMKTKRLFKMILSATRAEDSAPVFPQDIDADVMELQRATEGQVGTDELTVCSILSSRSDAQIRAISQTYENKYRKPLEKVISSEFSGHMRNALIEMVRAAVDRPRRDAIRIHEQMAGAGTKDTMLVSWITRCHWDREYMSRVKIAYKKEYGRDLASRIRSETSGDYEKILCAMVD